MFLAGCAESTLICFSTSQLAVSCVPPYRPGEEPLTLRVAVVPVVPAADGAFDCGVSSGGGVACLAAVDSVKGSGPEAAAGCRNTSSPAEVVVPPLPLGLVSTTARVTAAARATTAVASRGRERHQGPFSGGPADPPPDPLHPPDPPGGAGGGGGGGPSRPPDNGPEGGPVGRSDGGCDGGCEG